MCFSTPNIPAAVPPPPLPTQVDAAVQEARDRSRRARAIATGIASTRLTGGTSAPAPAGGGKVLLGG